jgi:hypothetical protein
MLAMFQIGTFINECFFICWGITGLRMTVFQPKTQEVNTVVRLQRVVMMITTTTLIESNPLEFFHLFFLLFHRTNQMNKLGFLLLSFFIEISLLSVCPQT